MPRISVVVPVYNVQDYLALCLQSVRRQTLDDIEIVCVNDGSTDRSGEVLRLFASVEPRLVVVEKENGGLSSARNAGIRRATGDIVCFLDSDDLLEESACETLANAFERSGATVVTYGASPYPLCGGTKWLNAVLGPRACVYDPFDPALLFKENSSPFAWRTACKRDFLLHGGVLFDESLPYGEDQVFQFQLYPRSPRTALIPDKLVRYRVSRSGSFMNARRDDPLRLARDHIEIVERVLRDWQGLGIVSGFASEALDWTAEFSLIRIFQLDEKHRLELLDRIAPVLSECFEERELQDYVERGLAGKFVKAALYDRRYAQGLMGKRSLYSYHAWLSGRAIALRTLGRDVAHARPWGVLVEKVERAASRRRAEALEAQWGAWEAEDARLREEALALVRSERLDGASGKEVV
ncbi:MAG TPA: glycosyltransferase family 2 protein [Candidatus Aphodovivens avistercoris]|nr:glycosyltransferase family 2 protein [Candidatus Aphodovivens avistercoris]